jgi:hypothetical protein
MGKFGFKVGFPVKAGLLCDGRAAYTYDDTGYWQQACGRQATGGKKWAG